MINSYKKITVPTLIALIVVLLIVGLIMPRLGSVTDRGNRILREQSLRRWHNLVEDYVQLPSVENNRDFELYDVAKLFIDPFSLDTRINLMIPPRVLWNYVPNDRYAKLLEDRNIFKQYCQYKIIFASPQNWEIIETDYSIPGEYYLSIDQDKRIYEHDPNDPNPGRVK